MRNFKNPPEMAYLTAKMAAFYDVKILYLRPKDIDIKQNIANGKILVGNKWNRKQTKLPKIIDISPYCFKKKNRHIMNYLRENSYLTDNRINIISKDKLQEHMQRDNELSHLAIPTIKYNTIKDLTNQIKKYNIVVMKPISGERGKGIYIISKKGRRYIIGHNKEEYIVPRRKLKKFFQNKINSNYIIQKYISSRALNGDPFDCRVHFEKNGYGKWVIAKIYVRIGIGQKVISNMNQGGAMAEPKGFLKANYPDKWKGIYQKLLNLRNVFPRKFEQLRGTDIMTLGIDVGIDHSGEIYVFEANGAPATAALRAEAVDLRTQYYKYLIDNQIYQK